MFSLCAIFSGCNTNNDCYTVRKPAPYTIQFLVNGSATTADILLVVEETTPDTTRLEDATLPWSKELTKTGDTWVYLAAQNQDSVGTVSTILSVNDQEFNRDGPSFISSVSYSFLAEDYMVDVLECP